MPFGGVCLVKCIGFFRAQIKVPSQNQTDTARADLLVELVDKDKQATTPATLIEKKKRKAITIEKSVCVLCVCPSLHVCGKLLGSSRAILYILEGEPSREIASNPLL